MSEATGGEAPSRHGSTLIRRVTLADAEQLRTIRLSAVRHDPDAFESTLASQESQPAEAWEAWAGAASAGNDQVLFFAEMDDEIVGLVGAFRGEKRPRQMMLISMWVAPQWRRRGVASALVQAVVLWASTADADEVSLWVVDGNDGAVATYHHCGFEFTEDTQPYARQPDKIERRMSLTIGSGRKAPLGYVEFVPMSSYEFDTYVAAAVPRSAGRLMDEGLSEEEASRSALESLAGMLASGEATPGHHLCTLRVGEEESPVGWIWFSRERPGGLGATVLHDLYVFDAYRRQGFASAALDELEEWAVTQGSITVAVGVDRRNAAASNLFSGLGYCAAEQLDETSTRLTKDLSTREIDPDSPLA